MISRTFLILAAFFLAAYRLSQAAWVEAAGLVALGGGLVCLQLAQSKPALKPLAWACFVVTAIAMVVSYLRLKSPS